MKTVSLVFDYNFKKQEASGRIWAKSGYRSKDFIFEYSAASFATFVDKNPNRVHIIDTDDEDLLIKKLKKYKTSLKNLDIRNNKELIQSWNSHHYCFWPLLKHIQYHANDSNESIVKLDNDLTSLKSMDELSDFDGALSWKFERNVKNGRPYWGEKYVCQQALGTDDFLQYNTGVLGISKKYLNIVDEFLETTSKLINVDASSVIRYREDASKRSKIYATSDQTSVNYVFHKYNINIKETYDIFNHHCYSIDAKNQCIEDAKYLLR
jgi:hypothetical protein